MDLTAIISNMQSIKIASQVQTAVARKVMDSVEQQGDAAISLLEAAKQVSDQMVQVAVDAAMVGATIDVTA